MIETTNVWLVWGCGVWPERRRVVDEQEPPAVVHEDHPDFLLLPPEFVRAWGENLGSEHWAEIVRCTESEIDQAARFSRNVYGWRAATGEREP